MLARVIERLPMQPRRKVGMRYKAQVRALAAASSDGFCDYERALMLPDMVFAVPAERTRSLNRRGVAV